jgi:hypothetical protein
MMVANTLAKLRHDHKSRRALFMGRSKKALDYEGIGRENQAAIHKMAVYYSCQRLCQTITFFPAPLICVAAPVGVRAIGKLARGRNDKPDTKMTVLPGLWQPGRSEG